MKYPLERTLSTVEFNVITLILWLISVCLGVSQIYVGMGIVLSVGGLIFGSYVGFILPSTFWIKTHKLPQDLNDYNTTGDIEMKQMKSTNFLPTLKHKRSKPSKIDYCSAIFMLITGIFLMTGGVAFTILNYLMEQQYIVLSHA